MATKVELLEHLRKLSGMPPLNEEELSVLAEEELEEIEEVLAEAKAKKNENDDEDDDSDSEEDAEDDDDDDDVEDEESDDVEEDKTSKKDSKKVEEKSKKNEALTDTKKKASKEAGADLKVVVSDPGLDPEAEKHAPAADAGEEEVVEAEVEEVEEADAVQKTTADGGIPKGKQKVGDKSDEKNITPEKKKGAKAAGADQKVVAAEAMIPESAMTRIVKEAMDNAQGDDSQRMAEVGKVFNRMMVESFNGAQARREDLRELVNRSEVSKKMMVHEVDGKSAFGEGMTQQISEGLYESDKQDLKLETSQRLLSKFKIQKEDEEVDDNYVAEQMITDRLVSAKDES